jgi:hypothetical protein
MTSDVIEIGKIAAILRAVTNCVIASEAKQSRLSSRPWIASLGSQ